MNWTHFVMAVVAAGVASSFTDWFFFGVLFHGKYAAYPEVWRAAPGKSETKTILTVTLMGFVTCAAFVFLYHLSSLHGYGAALELAGIVWIMAPVPLTISNALYVKMHSSLVVSHSMGWLARLVAAALAAGWLL